MSQPELPDEPLVKMPAPACRVGDRVQFTGTIVSEVPSVGRKFHVQLDNSPTAMRWWMPADAALPINIPGRKPMQQPELPVDASDENRCLADERFLELELHLKATRHALDEVEVHCSPVLHSMVVRVFELLCDLTTDLE